MGFLQKLDDHSLYQANFEINLILILSC